MTKRSILTGIFLPLCILAAFSQTSSSDAEVIKYNTDISFKKGTLTKTTSLEIMINNRDGEEYTKVSIPYSKMNKVSKTEACIKDIFGKTIKKLSSSNIKDHCDYGDYSFYSDNMVKEFTLKHNEYPYILSYSFQEKTSEFLTIDCWVPVVDWEIPTKEATLTVEVPVNYDIAYRNNGTTQADTNTNGEMIRYYWQASYKPVDKPEIYMPDPSKNYPRVDVVPVHFKYDIKGSFTNWIEYGNWIDKLNGDLSDFSQEEIDKIKSITNEISDKREQIKALYHYLQDETRYVCISIETGGMKPFPASFVASNKYGDCKALANYMKAMLKVIGIKSCYTNIFSSDLTTRCIDTDFPSQQFNHAILFVPLEKDTIWLDCTSDGPFNYLGTSTQNREAFVVEKDNSHFVKTPALKPVEVLDTRKVEFSEKNDTETTALFNNTYRSNDFGYLSQLAKSANENQKTQKVHEYFIEPGFEPSDYKITTFPRDSFNIQLSYSALTHNIYNQYGNEKIIHLLPFSIPDFKKPALRKYPVQINYPVYKSDTLCYSIPVGYSVASYPENTLIDSEYGRYKIETFRSNSQIKIVKSFILNTGTYSLNQYPAFYNFIKKVTDNEKNTLIIANKIQP